MSAPSLLAQEDVQTTASGLQFQVLAKGDDSVHPKLGDKVKVHYTGTLVDGTKFDSSRDRGVPAEFVLGGVIPGWNEGLQLMTPGARFLFTIPPELAYGAEGRPPRIPANATLVFDVELIEVTPGKGFPEFVPGNPEKQVKLENGLIYEVLEEGEGRNPTSDEPLELDYALWTTAGKLLDTSATKSPVKGPAETMTVAFLKEAPLLMKPGARWRFEVPPELGFGDRAQPGLEPNSTTIWELKLVRSIEPLPVPEFELPADEELQTTASGLKYQVVREGEGTPPLMGQDVTVHYAGWLTDGTLFDSSFTRGEMATFTLGRVIAGWNEGLQLMKPGAVYRFVIPSDLAYGQRGAPPAIGPDATLVFHVELAP
ncbi:MAG: FKBP-type peptidyl-prolyl cis-trans isomerase [Planctomycetes bacterium]|nr:FKBP-type peptidyl-prolyl cis-trans isomerase [Planctomycetota bacterium]